MCQRGRVEQNRKILSPMLPKWKLSENCSGIINYIDARETFSCAPVPCCGESCWEATKFLAEALAVKADEDIRSQCFLSVGSDKEDSDQRAWVSLAVRSISAKRWWSCLCDCAKSAAN